MTTHYCVARELYYQGGVATIFYPLNRTCNRWRPIFADLIPVANTSTPKALMMAVQHNGPKSPATWFILVSGGEKRAEDEANTRKGLKKIYTTILEQKLAERDHIVYLGGGQGRLSIDSEYHSYEGSTAATLSALLDCSESSEEGTSYRRRVVKMPEDLHVEDSAVVIFIGHGNDPSSWSAMPPSANGGDTSLGALVFVNQDGKKSLYSPRLPMLKHTLFISLACYSGNTFQKVLTGDQSRMMGVCLADPDHPASYDPILGQAFADFFKNDKPKPGKDQTIMQFCDYLQDKYQTHPYLLQMKRENLDQTEADYEIERKEAAEWAVKEFEGYLPRIIPHDLWMMFQDVESLKNTIEDTKPDDLSQVARSKLLDHISKLEDTRFNLMRMYKHKPNNRFCLCGATDVIGKMTWREFLHLPADEQ